MGIKRGKNSESSPEIEITEDEAELYDRQIRLWGLESQKRLRDAKILIVGLGGLGAEVAKNIALAGVKSLRLVDDKKVGPNECSSQFLLADAKQGENRAEASQASVQQLNPNVEVIGDPESINDKSDEYFMQFKVVCVTDCPSEVLFKLNHICRQHEIMFFCGDVWGMHGFCFVDLGSHKYLVPKCSKSSDDKEPPSKKQRIRKKFEVAEFGSLEKALSFKSGKAGIGLHKKITNIFFLVHILLKFREVFKRYPEPAHRSEDVESLLSIRKTVMENLGFDENKVSDEDLSDVFGEVSPVCAVVGGVLAQQIIKGVSANEKPIRNFFLFNGKSCLGSVESVG